MAFDVDSLKALAGMVSDPRTPQVLRMLERIGGREKVETGGTATLTSNLLYQGGGLFDVCVGDTLINASLAGVGLMSAMPFVVGTEEVRQQAAISSIGGGAADASVEQNEDICADPPRASFAGCEMAWCFGTVRGASPEYNLMDAGLPWCQRQPRFRLFGNVSVAGEVIRPSGTIIDNDPEWGAVAAATMVRQILGRWIWTGNPMSSPLMFKGLQLLINTGYVDARTGFPCDALDSDVKDFEHECINDSGSEKNIYSYLSAVIERIKLRAMGAGMGLPNPSDMAIVAPSWMLAALYNYWSCMMGPCWTSTGGQVAQIDQMAARAEAERYRRGQFLPVNGWDIPTIADDYQPFVQGVVGWEADIYVLTFQIGGMPVLFGEYQDFNTTSLRVLSTLGINPGSMSFSATDGGRYLIWQERKNTCFDVRLASKIRIVCLAPFLQGRITNVCVQTLQSPISPVPWDYPYTVDGGATEGWHYPLVDGCEQ